MTVSLLLEYMGYKLQITPHTTDYDSDVVSYTLDIGKGKNATRRYHIPAQRRLWIETLAGHIKKWMLIDIYNVLLPSNSRFEDLYNHAMSL